MSSLRLKLLRAWVSWLSSSYRKLCGCLCVSIQAYTQFSSAVGPSPRKNTCGGAVCHAPLGTASGGLLGPFVNAVIITATGLVVGPLVDTAISIFDEGGNYG